MGLLLHKTITFRNTFERNMRFFVLVLLFLNTTVLMAQYHFSGEVSKENAGSPIYLSVVEDYRKSSRVYLDQIVKKSIVDSLGHFQFEGNNLKTDNRIYRIHVDGCSEEGAQHFLGQCNNSKSVLFIANNKDTVQFPTSFENQALCTIASTNPNSSLLLEVQLLKEQMAYDFMEYHSEANKKLNLEKWFDVLQNFGKTSQEPLAELFIYDFLSDKRNETYGFYLQNLGRTDYYDRLSERLQSVYPNSSFTQEYLAEISTDQELANFNKPKSLQWKWPVLILLLLSLLGNVYFLLNRKKTAKTKGNSLFQRLTPQEQKIVQLILMDKSNKEIATELFVSLSTVKTHINNLYKKLDISSREEIVILFKK